jgi:hypothetical protein
MNYVKHVKSGSLGLNIMFSYKADNLKLYEFIC